MVEGAIRYYSRHLFRAVDLEGMFRVLWEAVPEVGRWVVEEMSAGERAEAAEVDGHGIVMVRHTVFVYGPVEGGGVGRRRDVEERVKRLG